MYSHLTGIWKGIKGALVFGISIVVVAWIGSNPVVANTPVVDIISKGANALFGGITVGALVTYALNWFKNKNI